VSVTGTIPEKAPLSVLLFHAAMEAGKSISDFAEDLDVGAISLRQFIEGNTQRPRTKTLELIGGALELPLDEVRRHMGYSPEPAQPFGEWLDRTIKATDYSRARLTRETEISDGALRNYLANKTMPDADQARKIVDALQADAYEVAHLIVANTVAKKGGTLAQAEATAMQAGATIAPLSLNQDAPSALSAEFAASAGSAATVGGDEAALLSLWRQLHPQGRRATLSYIAMLLAER